MHTVRIYLNRQEGATWWAEDDLGFTGGANLLSDLIETINGWAVSEGVLDELDVRLVSDLPETPVANPFSVMGLLQPESAAAGGVLHVGPERITE